MLDRDHNRGGCGNVGRDVIMEYKECESKEEVVVYDFFW